MVWVLFFGGGCFNNIVVITVLQNDPRDLKMVYEDASRDSVQSVLKSSLETIFLGEIMAILVPGCRDICFHSRLGSS